MPALHSCLCLQAVSDFVRNNFVTYIFSDHVIGELQLH
jgi:hypothetical protein